jgi:hypothetical protein
MLFFNMIDWFTGLVGYNSFALKTGKMLWLTVDGDIELDVDRWVKVPGSFESSIELKPYPVNDDMVKAARKHLLLPPVPRVFRISGNPTKFLQGHNVFGPPVASLGPVIREVMRRLPGKYRPPDVDSPFLPTVQRSRVDVTTSIRMDNHNAVHEWITHAKQETRSKHRGIKSGLTGPSTMSWGFGSRRWNMTAYCKRCELDKKPPRISENHNASLFDFADGLLRIELRLQSLELKDRGTLNESIIWTYFDRIEVGVMKKDAAKGIEKLRPPVKAIYKLWLAGENVQPVSGLVKRASFYQYRKEILEATGQDISLDPVKKKPAAGAREQFGVDYLKAREIKNGDIPANLQEILFKPGDSPTYPAH